MCLCDSLGVDLATCRAQLAPGSACGVVGTPGVAIGNVARQQSLAAAASVTTSCSGCRSRARGCPPPTTALPSTPRSPPATTRSRRRRPPSRLLLATDGGFSCAALSLPVRTGYSDGACADWEQPDGVNQLITSRRTDPTAPVGTVVIGLVRSHWTGQIRGHFPPPVRDGTGAQHLRVQRIAPSIDPACSRTATFTMTGAAPAMPCHIDLAGGSTPTAAAIARRDATGAPARARLRVRRAGATKRRDVRCRADARDAHDRRHGAQRAQRTTPTDACATDAARTWTGRTVTLLGRVLRQVLQLGQGDHHARRRLSAIDASRAGCRQFEPPRII